MNPFRHLHGQAHRVPDASVWARLGEAVRRIPWSVIYEAGAFGAMLLAIFAAYGLIELWSGR
jgi:hypothetical protein